MARKNKARELGKLIGRTECAVRHKFSEFALLERHYAAHGNVDGCKASKTAKFAFMLWLKDPDSFDRIATTVIRRMKAETN